MKISIDSSAKKSINPGMMGLFFEDINYAADGGLYAEMLENRNFSFHKTTGDWGDYVVENDFEYAWSINSPEYGSFSVVTGSAHSENNPFYARIAVKNPEFRLENKAYEGLYIKAGLTYKIVFYLRTRKFEGNIIVGACKENTILGKSCISIKAGTEETYNHWKKYETEISFDKDYDNAAFFIGLDSEGVVEIDFISMIPADAVAGIFRKDLLELLKGLTPGFLRFPGGCIVEGNTLDNRYNYKNTLKECYDRKTNWNRWAIHGTNAENNYETVYSHYNQTLGIGFYEYFLLCELIGAKPLPVLNVGFSCQYQNDEIFAIESDEFKNFVQDALDLVEFANGSENSTYGKIRALLGHPEPFKLEFMGIGNEQWQTEKADFFERYVIFEKAVHEKYPYIKLIGSAGPDTTSEKYAMAWDFYRKHQDEDNFAYALDEHYYVKPEWLFEHNEFYDNYDRKIKVFSGEYAAHPCSGFNMPNANTLWGALSEAAFMTGLERNADVVVMASYAPLFARVNYAQWSPDMIWFDGKIAYGTPSYYVQKMYANNMGDYVYDVNELKELRADGIFISVSEDSKTNKCIVKVINSNTSERKIDLSGLSDKKTQITGIMSVLSGSYKDAYNCIDNPDNVKMTSAAIRLDEEVLLKPLSFSVITF